MRKRGRKREEERKKEKYNIKEYKEIIKSKYSNI
jgi:hypothetical protein